MDSFFNTLLTFVVSMPRWLTFVVSISLCFLFFIIFHYVTGFIDGKNPDRMSFFESKNFYLLLSLLASIIVLIAKGFLALWIIVGVIAILVWLLQILWKFYIIGLSPSEQGNRRKTLFIIGEY